MRVISFHIEVERPSFLVCGQGYLLDGITVLTGPSGSGKSTFLKSLAGLVKPRTGFIVCNDEIWLAKNLDSLSEDFLRLGSELPKKDICISPQNRHCGYMPQGNIVFPHLSVAHNIIYSKRGNQALFDRIVSSLGLLPYLNVKAGCLSGGEQQRVALGRALYAKPSVLLLDEPLSALDWHLREQVQHELLATIEEWKIPCLWVTHNQKEAKKVGHRQWTCKDGQIINEFSNKNWV